MLASAIKRCAQPLLTASQRSLQTSLRSNTRLDQGLEVIHDFVSTEEANALLELADGLLNGLPYESSHYDNYIRGYRECGLTAIHDSHAAEAVRRMRVTAWDLTEGAWRRGHRLYPHAQLIDLLPEGGIAPHRDNFKLFGEFTAGLNLTSSVVLRFRPCGAEDDAEVIDALLRPRTLYVMHAAMRWEYTHEVLDAEATQDVWPLAGEGHSSGRGDIRGRRISVIVRDMGQSGFLGSDGLW